jgi:hypothetical protein
LLRGSSGKIGFFLVFSEIFPKSWISAQKQDTRAILLKTALVCVSYIQNTKTRGGTIAKVFGKVDMFWTYQGGLPPPRRCPANAPFFLLIDQIYVPNGGVGRMPTR